MSTPLSFAEGLDVFEQLREYYTPAEAALWLASPHPQLEGRTPLRCSKREVQAIIDRLESDTYL